MFAGSMVIKAIRAVAIPHFDYQSMRPVPALRALCFLRLVINGDVACQGLNQGIDAGETDVGVCATGKISSRCAAVD
jgi:hypothetical protein